MTDDAKSARVFWSHVSRMARRISGSAKAARPPPKPRPRAAPAAKTFSRRLRRMLEARGELAAGAIHVINLDGVRRILDAQGRWEAMAERVETLCTGAIGRRLDIVDMMLPLSDTAFFIVFARLCADEARVKCALIAAEIERCLSSWDPAFRDIRVGAGVVRMTQGEASIEGIDVLAETVRLAAEADTTVVGAAPSPEVRTCSEMVEGRATGEDVDLVPAWERPARRAYAFDNPWVVNTVTPIREQGGREQENCRGEWHYEPRPDLPSGLSHLYMPMWHVRNRAIGTFLCLPTLPVSCDRVLMGDAIYAAAPPLLVCQVDIELLGKVRADVEALLASGRRAKLVAPVHFETLARAGARSAYLAACERLSKEARRHLTFELVDLPEGAPPGRITELLLYLRPFSSAVNVRTSLSRSHFDAFAIAKVSAIGVALGREALPETEVLVLMESFTQAAERAGVRTYVFELRTRSLAAAARGAGFDYISGSAIGTATDAPEAAYRFDTLDIYADLFK